MMIEGLHRAFTTVPDTALYDEANWGGLIERRAGLTLDQAYAHAMARDDITYFFRIHDGANMYLTRNGNFPSSEAVFFGGGWWLGSAVGLAHSYRKNAGKASVVAPTGPGIERLQYQISVPRDKPASGLCVWIGLRPGRPTGNTSDLIGNGMLRIVLAFGDTVLPGAPNPTKLDCANAWWVQAQYVNDDPDPTHLPQFRTFTGGPRALVDPGQMIKGDFSFDQAAKIWQLSVWGDQVPDIGFRMNLTSAFFAQSQFQLEADHIALPGAVLPTVIGFKDVTIGQSGGDGSLATALEASPVVFGVQAAGSDLTVIDQITVYSPVS